jgi:uncharacterized protein YkwD
MNRMSVRLACQVVLLVSGLAAALTTRADVLSAMQILREGGCGGTLPAARPLQHSALLDQAAEQWAAGRTPAEAARRNGYEAESTAGLHIAGPDASAIQLLRRSNCRTVTDRNLRDVGIYQRGLDTWLVLAVPYVAPSYAQTSLLSTRALQLINDVRARGTRCGERTFGPVAPVRLSDTLATVAYGHAIDMAEHNYFEHQDLSGRSPADRVRAVGYREKLVGENIAYGPKSADEVVQGWIDSPDHCENIMDPRFAEMGIAFASGQSAKHGLYWVQLLAAPRA